MSEKMLERIICHIPESLYTDALIQADREEIAAGALLRKALQQYLYGKFKSRGSERISEDRG